MQLRLICAQGIIRVFQKKKKNGSTFSASPLLHSIALAKCIKQLFEVKELFSKLDLMKPCCVDNDCQSFSPVSEQVNLFW